MIEIKDQSDTRIELYTSLQKAAEKHLRNGVFVAEGVKVFKKLLESDLKIISIFALPEYYEENNSIIEKRIIDKSKLYFASKDLMAEIIGFKIHSGVMAIASVPQNPPLENLRFPIVALNGIVDSENVGAIVRNCAAFGCHSIIYDKKTSSPYLRRAVRVSMGTVFDVDIHETNSLRNSLLDLKSNKKVKIISSEINENSIDIRNVDKSGNVIIVFGSEGRGIDSEILEYSDFIAHIAISPSVSSLNVAASSAIMLYEFL